MTGWYRDGSCRTDISDQGMHTVCAVITEQFLSYSKAQGNDLSTPQIGFPGLKKKAITGVSVLPDGKKHLKMAWLL